MIFRLNRLARVAPLSRMSRSSLQLKSFLPTASRNGSLFSTASAAKTTKESRLLRQLSSELTAQEALIKEAGEDMDPSAIMKEFSGFLEAGGWAVQHESGSALLKLSRQDEQLSGTVSISVDLNEIVNGGSPYFEDSFAAAEEEAAEVAAEEEAMEESEAYGNYSSFPLVVEVNRDGKTLSFECLAEQTDEASTLSVENVSIIRDGSDSVSSYHGPAYEQLDEELKEAFDQFVAKVVKPEEMLDFIQIYGQAVESIEYKNWLQSVKDVLN